VNLDIGLMTSDLRVVPAYARRAEQMDFGAMCSPERRPDPFLPLADLVPAKSPAGDREGMPEK
jgi:hypothetical protein